MMLGLQRTLYRLRPTSAIGTFCMLAVLVSLMGVDAASAQLQVSGSVVAAEDLTPLPGVNIVEVGTTRGASTDFDGKFSFIASSPTVDDCRFICGLCNTIH